MRQLQVFVTLTLSACYTGSKNHGESLEIRQERDYFSNGLELVMVL